MNFGQAFEDAGNLLTLLGLLAVMPVVLVMTQNMTNPNFDMIAAFEAAIFGIVDAVMPAFVATFTLAVILWAVANSSTGR